MNTHPTSAAESAGATSLPDRAERLQQTARPSVARLWLVELRKLIDTPAGLVLVGVGAVLAGVFGGGAALLRDDVTYGDVARMAGIPGGMLVPVLAILLVTGERQHRTALTTYALVPQRDRILLAKVTAVITLVISVSVLALLAAAAVTPISSAVTGTSIPWTFDGVDLVWFTVGMTVSALSGLALALLIGNGPAAIVVVLAWPVIAAMLSVLPTAAAVLDWVDVAAVARFADGITSLELGQAATGFVAWVVIPGFLGWVRERRAEVR